MHFKEKDFVFLKITKLYKYVQNTASTQIIFAEKLYLLRGVPNFEFHNSLLVCPNDNALCHTHQELVT